MIANARMYSVTPEVGMLWRRLLEAVIAKADAPVEIIDHLPPAPISELWRRPDKAAVFMCGLPFSLATPRPILLAAPVPSPAPYDDRACYWTDFVVQADSEFHDLERTFGHRLALTTAESQSGFAAALEALMAFGSHKPLFREIVEPCFTPLGALTAVVEGRADVAPLDSYALALLRKYMPELVSRIRVVGSTQPTAIPALVASPAAPGRVVAQLAAAFLAIGDDVAVQPLLEQLLIRRFAQPEGREYDDLREAFSKMQAFWRQHPLADFVHPAFAAAFEKQRR